MQSASQRDLPDIYDIIMIGTVGIKRHLRTCPSIVHLANSFPF